MLYFLYFSVLGFDILKAVYNIDVLLYSVILVHAFKLLAYTALLEILLLPVPSPSGQPLHILYLIFYNML